MPLNAAGRRVEPPVSVPVAAGAMRAATAAAEAARGAARSARLRPWVAHRTEVRAFVGRAHGELVHVALAQQHRPGPVELLDDVRVVGADKVLQYPRAAGGVDALGAVDVLERDRDAGQRTGVCCVSLPSRRSSASSLLQSEVAGSRPDKAFSTPLSFAMRSRKARQLD